MVRGKIFLFPGWGNSGIPGEIIRGPNFNLLGAWGYYRVFWNSPKGFKVSGAMVLGVGPYPFGPWFGTEVFIFGPKRKAFRTRGFSREGNNFSGFFYG